MYVIFNSITGNYLNHPVIGLWNTTSRIEAEEMLKAACDFVNASGYRFLDNKICIKEVGTNFDPELEKMKAWLETKLDI